MSSRDSTTVTVYFLQNSLLIELRLRDQIRSAVIEFYWVPTVVTSLAIVQLDNGLSICNQ